MSTRLLKFRLLHFKAKNRGQKDEFYFLRKISLPANRPAPRADSALMATKGRPTSISF